MQVDRHVVAVGGRPGDLDELGLGLAHPVDLAVDLGVVDDQGRHGGLQAVVAGDADDRADLDDGIEADRAGVFAAGDVDLRRGDRVDRGLDERLGVEVGDDLAQRLGPQGLGPAHPGLEDLARHLAGAEPRDPGLLGDRPDRVVQCLVDLGLVDFDRQADLVAFDGFGGSSHNGALTLPAIDRVSPTEGPDALAGARPRRPPARSRRGVDRSVT